MPGSVPSAQPAPSDPVGQAYASDGGDSGKAGRVRVTLHAGEDGQVTTQISVVDAEQAPAAGTAANGVQSMDADDEAPPPAAAAVLGP